MITEPQIRELIATAEGTNVEFKRASSSYSVEKLAGYIVALANEGGGYIVLGVTDKRPRSIVGTSAFPEPGETEAKLYERLHRRVRIHEVSLDNNRILIVDVPSRDPADPWHDSGRYLMRAGDALLPLPPDQLAIIFDEGRPDFSAETCEAASLEDLHPNAVEVFRARWHRRSGMEAVRSSPVRDLLRDAELTTEQGLTYAALIMMGKQNAMLKYLPNAELIFEYRNSEASGPAAQRVEYRSGFLLYHDDLWKTVNLRNENQHYQEGLFVFDVPTFNERAVRESVLNAVAHRDYRRPGSVFVRQYPRRMEIVSPGGFPIGITPDNIIDRQEPRNRRLAEAMAKCGLVERAGQGANLIFESCVREGKALPDFSNTDDFQVSISLLGDVQDPMFVRFLERIAQETGERFNTHTFLLLDRVHKELPVRETDRSQLQRLIELGVVERMGRGRGTRYSLARRYYTMADQRASYTRRRGLDHDTNKALLLRHLTENLGGTALSELQQVLPHMGKKAVQRMLSELREDELVHLEGQRRWARWYIGKAHDR